MPAENKVRLITKTTRQDDNTLDKVAQCNSMTSSILTTLQSQTPSRLVIVSTFDVKNDQDPSVVISTIFCRMRAIHNRWTTELIISARQSYLHGFDSEATTRRR